MTDAEVHLRAMSDMYHRAGQPCMESFILEHGMEFSGRADRPGRKGRIRYCFSNSVRMVINNDDLIYCEGIAVSVFPVHHAWVVNKDGEVIETTWAEHGTSYYGIPFTTKMLNSMMVATGYYGLLYRRELVRLIGEITPWKHDLKNNIQLTKQLLYSKRT